MLPLLSELIVSFAQDFGDAWNRGDRIRMDRSEPVFNSGLDVGWVLWSGHSFWPAISDALMVMRLLEGASHGSREDG